MSLSCYYAGQSSTVDALAPLGSFTVQGQGVPPLSSCPDNVGIVDPSHPVVQGISVLGLANWGCSIHEAFTSYPPNFSPIVRDEDTGLPYVLATAGGGGVITDAPSRYAPFVYLQHQEKSFPNDAADFIRSSRLRWSHDGCRDHAVENPDGSDASYDAIDQSRLGAAAGDQAYSHPGDTQVLGVYVCHHGSTNYLANQYTAPRAGGDRLTSGVEGMFLDLKNSEHQGNPSLANDPVYYDYLPGHYVVYWFFYNYDDGAGSFNHEGDWEHVVVHLSSSNQATEVAYYHHACAPIIKSWPELAAGDGTSFGLYQGTHPIVYSAKGVHGSYPTAGSFTDLSTCQFQTDHTDAQGLQWQTWTNLRVVQDEIWYGFGGAWGEIGNTSFTTGPVGPSSFKGSGAPDGW